MATLVDTNADGIAEAAFVLTTINNVIEVPPIINCWISADQTNWLQIATDTPGATCGATIIDDHTVGIQVLAPVPGWFALVVVAVPDSLVAASQMPSPEKLLMRARPGARIR